MGCASHFKAGYSEAEDHRINALRLEGMSWDAVAQAIGRPGMGGAVASHARRVNLPCLGVVRDRRPDPRRQAVDRDPLVAGHPVSWGAIRIRDARFE